MTHLGHGNVFDLVKTRFYWPNYEEDIHDFVTKTCNCLKDKKSNQAQ